MQTRSVEIQRVAVATLVSDQRRANASRWTKASATATALLTPTAGSRPPLLVVGSVYPEQRSILPAQRSYHTPTAG
jgi:hypothetical protein